MYEIRKNGAVIAMTDAPTYIRVHPEGFYILCPESEAEGVAVNGTVYALRPGSLGESEDVIVVERDGGTILKETGDINNITFVAMAEAGSIDDVTAGEHLEAFAAWAYPVAYNVGNLRKYDGKLYRCITAHTSQEDWTPETAASLWTLTSDPEEEWPAWSQPIGAQDAYGMGDKVSHGGKRWVSTADNNVWEPGVYGWEEATE